MAISNLSLVIRFYARHCWENVLQSAGDWRSIIFSAETTPSIERPFYRVTLFCLLTFMFAH